MASTHKSLRSGTANKRPTTSIADGQIALNTNTTSPGLFFKDSTGATIIKVGPVHVGTTAPNASPAAGGSAGNSVGEIWLDTSLTPVGVKIWNGSAFVNATPIGSTTVQGLLELATNAETQTGTDPDRAVTPAGLQSKVSDSTSTTSSTTIASSTAVKSAYDLANAALPKSGGTVTGNLEIGTTGSLSFEGATADAFETTIAVVDPTADRTITLPDTTGTVVTTGDTGTVTSTMITDGTIVDGDISASAEIAVSKLADGTARQLLQTDAAGTGVEWASNIDVPGTLDVTSTATFDSIASHPLGSAAAPTITFTGDTNTGIYSPGADQVAISTGGSGRLFVDASGRVIIGAATAAIGNPLEVVSNSTALALGVRGRSADNVGVIGFYPNNSSTEYARIQSNGDSSLAFGTGSSGSERLRITSAGLVGVGTSSPQRRCHIVSSADGYPLRLESTAQPAATIEFLGNTTVTAPYIGAFGDNFAIVTGNVTRLHVASGGNVGIGTTTVDFSQFGSNTGGVAIADIGSVNTGLKISDGSYHNYLVQAGNGNFYISHYGAGDTVFSNGTSGEEACRIDASRRLLVGTSSARSNFYNIAASANLQLEGAGGAGESRRIAVISSDASSTAGGGLLLAHQRSGTVGGNTIVQNGDSLGVVTYQGNDGSEFVEAANIACQVDGTPGANDMPGRLVFSTTADGASSPTERMRISNDGQTSLFGSGNIAAVISSAKAAGTTDYIIQGRYGASGNTGGTTSFQVFTNGNTQNTNNSYAGISDVKLKENITDANSQWADIKALQVRNYNFKEGQTHTQIGLIAQEVELVSPGLVSESPDRDPEGNDLGTVTKSVNYSVLYMKAVKALQEAMDRIEQLEAKVAALESA